MKKYLLLFILAVFVMSCSKKVDVKGKITNSSPLERIEFIDASGVSMIPLANLGIKNDGTFSGNFQVPKNGMYVITYGGRQNLIYLKAGQNLEIYGNGSSFPSEYVVTGDGKKNNDFFMASQKYLANYSQKVNMNDLMTKDESAFIKGIQKVEADINKNIDENAKKFNPDNDLVKWKQNDIKATLLSIISQFEMMKKQMSGNPTFRVTKVFADYENKLQENKDIMIKEHPLYRQYLLSKMSLDFQKFAEAKSKGKVDITTTELFNDFLKTKKDMSQTTKDYLLAFVMTQSDIHLESPAKTVDKIKKIIDEDIKDATIKKDLNQIQLAVNGLKIGEVAPDASLIKSDGKVYKLSENKGKPYMITFYASWNPYISNATVPVLKEVVNFYKSKMNFVFVNVDDSKDQFIKTSNSLLKGIAGTNVYADGGLNSDIAKKYAVYGFKLPSFVVIDKNGKIASRSFVNLGKQELVEILNKQTGLFAPKVNPNVQLNAGFGSDPAVQSADPQDIAKKESAVSK